MFAPKVAKPQTKTTESPTNKVTFKRSILAGRPFGGGAIEQVLMLQRSLGNQATLRLLAQQASRSAGNELGGDHEQGVIPENITTRETMRGVSWDFSKIPLFPPDRPNQLPAPSPLAALPLQGAIQPKLAVGQVNDSLEHEADRVADQVMHMPAPDVSITAAPLQVSRIWAAREKNEKPQTKEVLSGDTSEAPAVVNEVLRSPGQPLDGAPRAFFEPRFGRDFSQVRVHTGTAAEQSARNLDAQAYTVGNHIVFGQGHSPSDPVAGARILSHELTHVVQQSGGDVKASPERRTAFTRPSVSGCSVAVQRQKAKPEAPKPASHFSELEKLGARWIGRIRGTYSAALRITPSKDPDNPHAGTLADLDEGEFVEVHGHERGWLKVGATVGGRQIEGYVSQELVAFDRWDLDPEAIKTGLTMREAFVVLKRAETHKTADAGYKPSEQERTSISAAIATVKGDPKYQVNETTYRVTFASTGRSKIKITTIEDFVLFVETVEAQYPDASAKEIVSEIRQLWFSDENWELLVDSEGITDRGQQVDIESLPNPLAAMFDMADLAPAAGGKVIATPLGDVDIGHVLTGIDARLSGGPASYPKARLKQDSPVAKFKYESLKQFNEGDPTAFATFAGDLGQAFASFIFDRYEKHDKSARLGMYISEFAKPAELIGDIHGYIAAAVANDVRASGSSPTGATEVKASSIIRDMYLVDKQSTGASAGDYLAKVAGKSGSELKKYIYSTSMAFAHVWYAKLVVDNEPELGEPVSLFNDYVREFSERADWHERNAEPVDTLSGAVDDFLAKAFIGHV